MMTRKHLQALAESVAEASAAEGLTQDAAVRVAQRIIKDQRAVKGVTHSFDAGRFEAAVREAYGPAAARERKREDELARREAARRAARDGA